VPLSWFSWFKAAVFALLAGNSAVFVLAGTASEALDAAAWLVLLALFELETGFGERFGQRHVATVIRAVRLAAAIAIGTAAVGYVHDHEWLDAINAWLWIAVVVLLEFEVRRPRTVALHRTGFSTAAAALYTGLAAVIPVWAWRGEWFDAYDALLWLAAFATIEINVLRIARREEPAANAASTKCG
jgi:hypothetical protein